MREVTLVRVSEPPVIDPVVSPVVGRVVSIGASAEPRAGFVSPPRAPGRGANGAVTEAIPEPSICEVPLPYAQCVRINVTNALICGPGVAVMGYRGGYRGRGECAANLLPASR